MESATKNPSAPSSTSAPNAANPGASTARTITIDGMTGDACVQKVQGALKDVPNVTTQAVKVGAAHISADQTGCDAACKAVESAGYKCRAGNTDAKNDTKHDANNATNKPGISNAAAPTAPASAQTASPQHAAGKR
ncbi:MAG: hypothetical protein ACKVZJ_16140 [Phycisphaerales bacterium]